jgi:glycerate dehydrogenase
MKIVEMDGYAANPGDISWEPWRNIALPDGGVCDFVMYERTAPELVVERAKGADMVITNKVMFSREVMEALPELRYIGVLATGYNVVDIAAAKERGIVVTNIPAYSTQSVAQLAIAHLLHITNNVAEHDRVVHEGGWTRNADFSFWVSPQRELAGKTFGVVGLGNTGTATARIAAAIGMKVLAFSSKGEHEMKGLGIEDIRKATTIGELFSQSDVVSLHCPLTETTKHIVNKTTLGLMKSDAILLNTGRGPLIDEQALADALNEGSIYAAGIDVLTEEPPRNGSPLLTARNCYITPHIAWATLAARERLMQIAIENIKAFLRGEPQNVVQ